MKLRKLHFAIAIVCLTFLIAFSQTAYALYPTTDPWTMYRHDIIHSGYTTSTAPNSNRTIWSSAPGSTLYNPVVVNGMVIVNDYYNIYALDETTGIKIWGPINHAGGYVYSPLTVVGDRIYVGVSGYLDCYNATNGAQIWSYQASTTGNIYTAPAVANGRVYFGTTDNYTIAIDAITKAFRWHFGGPSLAPIYSSPAVDGTWVYFGADNGKLYALNDTGSAPQLKWVYSTGNQRIRSTPTIGAGLVIFSPYYQDHSLFAVNKTTGQLVWKYTMSSYTENSPSFYGNRVFFANYYTYKVYALYANVVPGNYSEVSPAIVNWSTPIGSNAAPTSTAVADGKVFVGASDGRIYALDWLTGIVSWTYKFSSGTPGEPIIADGRLFVSVSSSIYCFGSAFPPVKYEFPVSAAGYNFNVELTINATVTSFNVSGLLTLKKISYSLQGISSTIGASNITIPNAMLGGPYTVTVDGGLPSTGPIVVNDTTTTSLYFTYTHSTHVVEITGTYVIPEFPTASVLVTLMLATSAVTLGFYRFKRNRKLQF